MAEKEKDWLIYTAKILDDCTLQYSMCMTDVDVSVGRTMLFFSYLFSSLFTVSSFSILPDNHRPFYLSLFSLRFPHPCLHAYTHCLSWYLHHLGCCISSCSLEKHHLTLNSYCFNFLSSIDQAIPTVKLPNSDPL